MMKKNGWNSTGDKLDYAKYCIGRETLTPKCRSAMYDWLDDRNSMEWSLAAGYWWYGIITFTFLGLWQHFWMPLKMLLLLVVPDFVPSPTTDYTKMDWW